MAPPPGKRRSGMTYLVDAPLDTLVEPSETVDADPSDALTCQIASSILRERYGVDSAEAVPLKVHEAVRVCLRDVSSTVQHEHPHWGLPTYHRSSPPPPPPGSSLGSSMPAGSEAAAASRGAKHDRRSAHADRSRRRKRGPRQRGDSDDDPFQYDKCSNQDGGGHAPSEDSGAPSLAKKAKRQSHSQGYPCPYRRRNPVLFNIREHEHCARRNFANMNELKSVLSFFFFSLFFLFFRGGYHSRVYRYDACLHQMC